VEALHPVLHVKFLCSTFCSHYLGVFKHHGVCHVIDIESRKECIVICLTVIWHIVAFCQQTLCAVST